MSEYACDPGRPLARMLPALLEAIARGALLVRVSDGRVLDANAAFLRLLGAAGADAIERSAVDLGLWPDLPALERLSDEVGATIKPVALTVPDANDGSSDVEAVAQVITFDGEPTIVFLTLDPTDRSAVQRSLHTAEQRFERAFEEAPIGMALIGIGPEDQGCYLRVNRAFCEFTGYRPGELVGRHFSTITHADDYDATRREAERRVTAGEISTYELEKRYVRRDGSLVWARTHVTLVRDASGEPVQAVSMILDINDQKLAQQALRASEERYRGIVEATTDGVWMLDAADVTSFANGAFARMLGYDPAELQGLPATALMPEGKEPIRPRAMRRRADGDTRREEVRLCRKDGTELWAELSVTALIDERGSYGGAVVMVVDTTARREAELERHRLESQLSQAQRLETVGQLAGGVAHDFNNLLAVILNYAYFVREQLPPGSELRSDVEEIRHAAERASDLTHQLLVFSRKEAIKPEVLDLNSVVREMERLLRRTIGEHVALVTRFCSEPCMVDVDRSQLEQVLMNLVVNGRDAMPDGGTIWIDTELVDIVEGESRAPESLPPGRYATLSVRDDGTGMEPDVAAHAFEPFFTTKPKGAGTGLGLATVYGTVTASAGEAEVESEPGRGTTVRVWLREASAPAPRAARFAPSEGASGPLAATVLVVEDEDAVRRLTCRILQGAGFQCLEAGSGHEALELAARTDSSIELLVTDVVMPGMSGKELAERLGGADGPPALFMSGYTDGSIPYRDQPEQGTVLLHKPFTASALLRAVREVLEGEPAPLRH